MTCDLTCQKKEESLSRKVQEPTEFHLTCYHTDAEAQARHSDKDSEGCDAPCCCDLDPRRGPTVTMVLHAHSGAVS